MHTPKYVFDSNILINNYRIIKEKLNPCELHFALKSNSNREVVSTLHKAGASFECASINEYELLREIGVGNYKIIFGLPIKTDEIIMHVYNRGCRYFVFEDMRELVKLEKLAPLAKKILRLYILDLVPLNIAYGMPIEQIMDNNQKENLLFRIDGISFHISNNINIENEISVLDRAEEVLKQIPRSQGAEFILNIGGSYRIDAPEGYYERLKSRLEKIVECYGVQLKAEPGMTIVNSAGSFFTRVVMTKEYDVYTDVYIDGGTPNGIFGEPDKVNVVGETQECKRRFYRFIDITCIHKVLFQKRMNVSIRDNDILEFKHMGAYSLVYQNKFHLWDETKVEVI